MRFARDPLRVAAAALVVGMLGLSLGVALGATTVVNDALIVGGQEPYDLIVTAADNDLGFSIAGADFIDPDVASRSSVASLTNDDLARISATAGVDIAAPLGFVSLTSSTPLPIVGVPLSEAGKNLDVTVTVSTHDGLAERVLQQYVESFTLAPGIPGDDGTLVRPYLTGPSTIGGALQPQFVAQGQAALVFPPLPMVSTSVVAVDPVAELRLIGSRGAFLQPLIDYETLEAKAGPLTCETVGCRGLPATVAAPELHEFDRITAPIAGAVNSALTGIYGGQTSRFVPYVRNSDAYAPLTIDISVSSEGIRQGETSVDLGSRLRPFADSDLNLAWPASDAVTVPDVAQSLRSTSLLFPGTVEASNGEPHREFEQQGVVGSSGVPVPGSPDAGATQTYRRAGAGVPLTIGYVRTPGAAPLEVGSYSSREVTLGNARAGIPLGAYDPATVTVGEGKTSVPLEPSLTGLGAAIAGAGAIVSLDGAAALGAVDPIDVVRVVVAGAGGHRASAAEVARVALRLSDDGYTVRSVRGASLQDIAITLPDFVTSSPTDPLTNRIVTLDGTRPLLRLGVANAIQSGVSGLTLGAYGVAVMSVVGVTAVVSLGSVATRRRESAIMARLGLGRARRLRWALAEELVPFACYLSGVAVLAITILTGGGDTTAVAGAGIAVGAIAVITAASAWSGSGLPRRRRRAERPRRPHFGPLRVGATELVAAPGESIAWVVCTASLILGISVLSHLLPTFVEQASETRLGAFVVEASRSMLALVLGSACLAAVLALIAVGRAGRLRRRHTEFILRTLGGWTRTEVAWSGLARIVPLSLTSTVLGVGAALLLERPLEGSALAIDPLRTALVGVAAAVIAAAATVLSAPPRRRTRA